MPGVCNTLVSVNLLNSVATPAQKQLLLWIIKDLSKHSVFTHGKAHVLLCLCQRSFIATAPPPHKYLGNIPAICVYPLWILSHCYCFCYTFCITSCCFSPTQLRKKKKKKEETKPLSSHKRANLLYMKTILSKASKSLKRLYRPCTCLI